MGVLIPPALALRGIGSGDLDGFSLSNQYNVLSGRSFK
jgi:hypothetical protein